MGKKIIRVGYVASILFLCLSIVVPAKAQNSGFSVQVSPSPIIESIDPGVSKTVELKIRNQNTQKETFKMGLRAFGVDNNSGEVQLKNEEPIDVVSWVTFAEPVFSVDAGQWFTQKVIFDVPKDAGFTYSFAITVSRANPVQEAGGKTTIEGSVAIFALLSTNRSDAVRKLDISSFISKRKVYEYLPANFLLKIKNSGNTIVQPTGNIYIQRSLNSTEPIDILSVNGTGAYVLPDVTRTLQSDWTKGFPAYKDTSDSGKKKLFWNWSDLQNLRIGHYVAKAIVVYNDGVRDIPAEANIDFWVIPWKLMGGLLVIAALVITGVVSVIRKTMKVARKKQKDDATE